MTRNKTTGYIKYITDTEFKVLEKLIKSVRSPPLRIALKIMAYLGLRTIEAVSLKREMFNQDFSKVVYIRAKTLQPKERIIPSFLQQELIDYDKQFSHLYKEDYISFANFNGGSKNKHILTTTIRHFFVKARRLLGINEVYYITKNGVKLHRLSPHTLRHYAIYRYYKAANNDLVAASMIIGHKKIETTAKYINALINNNLEKQVIETAFNI